MSYQEEISNKLGVLLNKNYKLGYLINEIENITGINDKLPFGYENFIESINLFPVEFNEDFNKFIGRIEYRWGEDDNQVFIDYEIIIDNKTELNQEVKVIDIWW